MVIVISVLFLFLPAKKENTCSPELQRENFYSLMNYKPKIIIKSKPRSCSKVTVIKKKKLRRKSLRLHEIKTKE